MSIDENEEEDGEDAGSSTPDGLGLLSRRMPADDPTAGVGTRDLLRPQSQPAPDEADVESQAEQGEIPPSPSPEAEGETPASAHSAVADSDAPVSVPSAEGEGDTPGDAGEEHAQADFVSDLEGKADSARSSTWLIRSTARTADDPLLGCLTILCKLLDRPVSADALTAGLPLVDGRVTPPLFVRAASRVGIAARLTRRPLDSITSMALPCVLLLEGRRSCVLTRIEQGSSAEIALPDMGAGSRSVPIAELESEYIGYALFARPEFQFDTRSEDIRTADPKGWFWGTLVSSWKFYVEVVIAALLVNSFALASPLFIMNVYDRVVPNAAIETLWVLALGAATVFGFDFLLKMLRSYFVDVAGKTADTRIGARLFQQVLGMKMADRPASAGALASNLREFEHLRDFFTSSTLTAIVDFPFALLFIFIISIIGGAKIALIPLVAMLPIMIVGLIVQIPLRQISQQSFRESAQKHAILVEAITGIETIKTTASEGRMQRAWETFSAVTARTGMKAQTFSAFAVNFSAFSIQLVTIGVVIMGVFLIRDGELTVGALVASTMLTGRAMAPLSQIAAILTRFNQSRASLAALDVLMRTPVDRPDGKSFVSRPNVGGQITFKDVTFTYPDQNTPALNKVSFSINAGEKVGIVGRIGCGKSTLERLLIGLYEPEEGAILVDGTDVRQIDPADLRHSVGCVPQDQYLFFGSVKENIALGAPYADDATILRAARIAGVDEFVNRHPQGFDMPVGERGQMLSGGQRQSVAVARALLFDPPILVLDEPTSSMDNTTESRFKARLANLLGTKTMLLITHRGSMLSVVDRLIVLDTGRIVADGPKDEVLEALASGRIQAVTS